MKLSELKEGVLVRCSNCNCGKNEDGYVEGEIYFEFDESCPNKCRYAHHEGSEIEFAFEECPECYLRTNEKRR